MKNSKSKQRKCFEAKESAKSRDYDECSKNKWIKTPEKVVQQIVREGCKTDWYIEIMCI